MTDVLLMILLVLLNGVFAMSEIAVVSSRKARLQHRAEEGDAGAKAALALSHEPAMFLSTIQVGITSVGILNGAIGEAALADPLTQWLAAMPFLADYARGIALTVVVIGLTYFSVVVGELVPKGLGLLAPETVAAYIARPMMWLSRLAHPLVAVLSGSSDLVLRLIGARRSSHPPVTDAEINVLMEQGAEAGIFHQTEQEIVSNVLRLDDQRVVAIMTPRQDVYTVDLNESEEAVRRRIAASPHARVVVCRGGLDQIAGMLRTLDMLRRAVPGDPIRIADIEASLQPPYYIPQSVTTTRLLENFRRDRQRFALIVNEYGDLQGIVTLTDVLTSIVGELSSPGMAGFQDVVRREDGSWLIDGSVGVERLRAVLDLDEDLPGEQDEDYHTVAGLIIHMLGRIPAVADHVEIAGLRFEILDMDRNRVDKVLVMRLHPQRAGGEEEETG